MSDMTVYSSFVWGYILATFILNSLFELDFLHLPVLQLFILIGIVIILRNLGNKEKL